MRIGTIPLGISSMAALAAVWSSARESSSGCRATETVKMGSSVTNRCREPRGMSVIVRGSSDPPGSRR